MFQQCRLIAAAGWVVEGGVIGVTQDFGPNQCLATAGGIRWSLRDAQQYRFHLILARLALGNLMATR
jgi:hypothetical protein